jgi:hypothetical protein
MSFGDDIREGFKSRREQRDAKMRRVFARPEQVTRDGDTIIVGGTPVENAAREAAAARKAADEARAAADAAKK